MKTTLFSSIQKGFILVLLLFFSVLVVNSQTLHMFIVTQQDSDIGAPTDKQTMKALADEIRTNVPDLTVNLKIIDGTDALKSRIFSEIEKTQAGNNDIIWYYYSGHGRNYNNWPMSDDGELPLYDVHNKLKSTNARLTIAMYDCCNYLAPLATPPSDLRAKSSFYKLLFMEASGNIVSASCSPNKLSFGLPETGGLYTNAFIDALRMEANWNDVFITTKRVTNELAVAMNKTQIPIYDIQNYTSEEPEPAPPVKTKDFSSLSDMALQLNSSYNSSSDRQINITVHDIKHWNPGVNENNFKNYEKLEIKFNDKAVGRSK